MMRGDMYTRDGRNSPHEYPLIYFTRNSGDTRLVELTHDHLSVIKAEAEASAPDSINAWMGHWAGQHASYMYNTRVLQIERL